MPFVELKDLSEGLLRPYSGMTDGQLRRGEGFRRDNPNGLFIGESALVIERAMASGARPSSLLVEERWLEHDRPLIDRVLAKCPDTPVFVASVAQFQELTGYEVVRGALACFERPEPLGVDEVLANATRLVILEDITNYANMGSMFRSAAGLGWDGVLVSPSCHDPLYRRCARVSMGAVFQVPWARIKGDGDWAAALVPKLREAGFQTVALALRDDALDLRQFLPSREKRLAVVLGTEGTGLRQSTIDACDHAVCIPMENGVDSLNVGVCAGIALFHLAC